MHVRTLTGGLAAALLVSLSLTGGQALAAPSDAADVPLAARVFTYDAAGSAEFRSAVDRGAAIWNESVDAVELRPVAAGQRANIRVLADNGWPRALPTTWATEPSTSGARPSTRATTRSVSPPTNSGTSWACPIASQDRARA